MVGFGDKPVDLVQEGVDCAIRVGDLEDSSLVARRLGELQRLTAASPAYIERHGEPTNLDDLRQHLAVQYFFNRTGQVKDMNFVVARISDPGQDAGHASCERRRGSRDVRRTGRWNYSGASIHATAASAFRRTGRGVAAVEDTSHAHCGRVSAQSPLGAEGSRLR